MTFIGERTIKALRRPKRCDGCEKLIPPLEAAVRWSGMTDDGFHTAVFHPDCRLAEIALNNEILGFQYGDDWVPLSHIEDEDRPWIAEAYPAVAQRLGVFPEESGQ